MSRYDNSGTTGGNGSTDDNYDDNTTLKLQNYAAVRLTPTNLTANNHAQYGTSLISNYEDGAVLDGVVFEREDKPGTWKVFSAGKFFHLNPEDGRVYESYDDEAGYTTEMSADDILNQPRVAGFSETFAGEDYYYTPIGVVVEAANDIAVNDDVDVETEDGAILMGDTAMLSGNKTWVRTFAKKMTEAGDEAITDNGEAPTPRGEPDTNPKYDKDEWLAVDDPTLRSAVEGREIELWVTENTNEINGDEVTYATPNVQDVKTGEAVTIDNGGSTESEATDAPTATADGGTTTADPSDDGSTESPDEPGTDDSGLPDGVPDHLDDLIDYAARNGYADAGELRDFAEDEVDDPDEVDWQAAADEAANRA